MFVSEKLCDLVEFPTITKKYSKCANLRNSGFLSSPSFCDHYDRNDPMTIVTRITTVMTP